MTSIPLKIDAQIIFIDRQIYLNTWNFKIIAYNQVQYKNKHGAVLFRFSIFVKLNHCETSELQNIGLASKSTMKYEKV